MIGHADEVSGAHFLVELHERLGVELLGFPHRYEVYHAKLRGMAEALAMLAVLALVLLIHGPCIPVARLGYTLQSPMGPDAQFGVGKPLGSLIVGRERLPRRLEDSFFDIRGNCLCQDGDAHQRPQKC